MSEFDIAAFVIPEVFICPFLNFSFSNEVYSVEFGYNFLYDASCFLFEVFAGEFFKFIQFGCVGVQGFSGLGNGHLFEFGCEDG